jgi:hypothetical protein
MGINWIILGQVFLSVFSCISTLALTYHVLDVGFASMWKNKIDFAAIMALIVLWLALAVGLFTQNTSALLMPIMCATMLFGAKWIFRK